MMRKKAGKGSQKKEGSAPKRRKINKENGYKELKTIKHVGCNREYWREEEK